MKFESKYNFNDKVWIAFQEPENYQCKFCNGGGKAIDANGDKQSCPSCYGFKYEQKESIIFPYYIYVDSIDIIAHKWDNKETIEIKYFLKSIPIDKFDDTKLVNEDKIFATKQECQIACDKWNDLGYRINENGRLMK